MKKTKQRASASVMWRRDDTQGEVSQQKCLKKADVFLHTFQKFLRKKIRNKFQLPNKLVFLAILFRSLIITLYFFGYIWGNGPAYQ